MIDENKLLKVITEIYEYQKDLQGKCQCEMCTSSEPSPRRVLRETFEKHLDENDLKELEAWTGDKWTLGGEMAYFVAAEEEED